MQTLWLRSMALGVTGIRVPLAAPLATHRARVARAATSHSTRTDLRATDRRTFNPEETGGIDMSEQMVHRLQEQLTEAHTRLGEDVRRIEALEKQVKEGSARRLN
jgi:hypothetical protein